MINNTFSPTYIKFIDFYWYLWCESFLLILYPNLLIFTDGMNYVQIFYFSSFSPLAPHTLVKRWFFLFRYGFSLLWFGRNGPHINRELLTNRVKLMITHIVRPPPPPKTLFVVRLRGTQVLVYGDGAAEVDVGFFQVLLTRDGGSVSGIGNIGIFWGIGIGIFQPIPYPYQMIDKLTNSR